MSKSCTFSPVNTPNFMTLRGIIHIFTSHETWYDSKRYSKFLLEIINIEINTHMMNAITMPNHYHINQPKMLLKALFLKSENNLSIPVKFFLVFEGKKYFRENKIDHIFRFNVTTV